MRKMILAIGLLGMLGWTSAGMGEDLVPVRDNPNEPVQMIFDTDMGNDVDDALALAIIHAMIDRGKCDLLGITLTKSNLNAARYCKAFNMAYGRPDIPIGLVANGPEPDDGRYVANVLNVKKEDGTPAFPYPADFVPEDSVVLLRKLLAAAKDNSVVIVQVGFSTNLARLLDTPGDAISPLTGRELAAKKVRLVSAMAGAFTFPNDRFKNHREYNIIKDIPAAQKFFAQWPTEILVSGFEVGFEVLMRPCSMQNDYNKAPYNIVKESYRFYRDGLDKTQMTWDLTSVLFVVRPEAERNYYTVSEFGNVTVLDDGQTRFTADAKGKVRCVKMTPEQHIRVEEAFVNLCSEAEHQ